MKRDRKSKWKNIVRTSLCIPEEIYDKIKVTSQMDMQCNKKWDGERTKYIDPF